MVDTDSPSNPALLHNQSIEQIGSPNSPGKKSIKSIKSAIKNPIQEENEIDGEEEPRNSIIMSANKM
jgi:hypothetical protein